MNQTPDAKPEDTATAKPAKPPPSRLQRVIEHGSSFAILVPAVASFFSFLVMVALLVPSHGGADGVGAAFAVSSNLLISAYIIGGVPSLLVGLLIYPLWRQFGGGWPLYLLAALFNATLCAATGLFFVDTVARIGAVAGFAALATLAAVFLTRKLRL